MDDIRDEREIGRKAFSSTFGKQKEEREKRERRRRYMMASRSNPTLPTSLPRVNR